MLGKRDRMSRFQTRGIRKRRRRRAPKRRRRTTLNPRIGGFLGIELKFYDTFLASGVLAENTDASAGEHNPSATISLNTVTQGDGESQRDGRNSIVKSLHIKGIINIPVQVNATALDLAPTIFVAIVHDKQTNGALLNSEDVYINPGGTNILGTSLQRNLQFIKRFRVLKTLTLNPEQQQPVWDGTNIEITGSQTPFEIHIPNMNIKTNYSGTTETIANIVDNGLNLIAWTTSTNYAPTISYNSRVRFVG